MHGTCLSATALMGSGGAARALETTAVRHAWVCKTRPVAILSTLMAREGMIAVVTTWLLRNPDMGVHTSPLMGEVFSTPLQTARVDSTGRCLVRNGKALHAAMDRSQGLYIIGTSKLSLAAAGSLSSVGFLYIRHKEKGETHRFFIVMLSIYAFVKKVL